VIERSLLLVHEQLRLRGIESSSALPPRPSCSSSPTDSARAGLHQPADERQRRAYRFRSGKTIRIASSRDGEKIRIASRTQGPGSRSSSAAHLRPFSRRRGRDGNRSRPVDHLQLLKEYGGEISVDSRRARAPRSSSSCRSRRRAASGGPAMSTLRVQLAGQLRSRSISSSTNRSRGAMSTGSSGRPRQGAARRAPRGAGTMRSETGRDRYVRTAIEALERIREPDYDAIVSDIKMPGMTGSRLLHEIRELGRRPADADDHRATVNAISPSGTAAAGAYDFVQKADRPRLLRRLARARDPAAPARPRGRAAAAGARTPCALCSSTSTKASSHRRRGRDPALDPAAHAITASRRPSARTHSRETLAGWEVVARALRSRACRGRGASRPRSCRSSWTDASSGSRISGVTLRRDVTPSAA